MRKLPYIILLADLLYGCFAASAAHSLGLSDVSTKRGEILTVRKEKNPESPGKSLNKLVDQGPQKKQDLKRKKQDLKRKKQDLKKSSFETVKAAGLEEGQNKTEVSFTGKVSAVGLFASNRVKYQYVFEPKERLQIYNFSGLFPSGSIFRSHEANFWLNTNGSELCVRATKKMNKFSFSLVLALSGDVGMVKNQSVREAYLEVAHDDFGTLVVGSVKGNENRASLGPHDFACASGGTDGAFYPSVVNATTNVFASVDIIGGTGVANKISFYSPRMLGFQLSLSYTPSTWSTGETKMKTASFAKGGSPVPFDLNNFCQGLTYMFSHGDFKLNLSGIHIAGKTQPEIADQEHLQRYNTKSWEFGAHTAYGPWNLGVDLLFGGRSQMICAGFTGIQPSIKGMEKFQPMDYDPKRVGRAFTINSGIGYIKDDWGVSLTCVYTERRTGFVWGKESYSPKATGLGFVLSLEKEICPGVLPYVEVARYRLKNPVWAYTGAMMSNLTGQPIFAVPSNNASGALAGLKIQF